MEEAGEDGSSSPKTTKAAALQELNSLRSLHASLLALKEMVKAVNKDYAVLSENYEKLAVGNEQWKLLQSSEGAKGKAN